MSSDTGEPKLISAAVVCMLDLEHEMGRTEVEIVENEERKKFYRMYKLSTVHAVKKGLTHETTSAGVNTSRSSCCNDSPNKAGHITRDTHVEQYVMECGLPLRSCSPIKWWEGIISDKKKFSETSNIEGINRNYKSKSSGFSCRISQVPGVSISPFFCGDRDRQQNGKGGMTRWNISTNIHSKPTAFRPTPTVSSYSRCEKTLVCDRNLHRSSARRTPHTDVGECHSSELSFVIHPPPALVLERFKRLIWLEDLLRIELEREALEDWYILRGELLGMGSKFVGNALLGLSSTARDERRVACKLGIYSNPAIPVSFSYNWERAKRRQERRFMSTELYSLRSDPDLVSHAAGVPILTKTVI